MRNAEFEMRNVRATVARRLTLHVNSAFHVPHSALGAGGGDANDGYRRPRAFLESRCPPLPLVGRDALAPPGVSPARLPGGDGRGPDLADHFRRGELPARRDAARGRTRPTTRRG